MVLIGTITSTLNWTQYVPNNFGIASNVNFDNETLTLNSGTGIGEIDTIWYGTLTGTQSLQLDSLEQKLFHGTTNVNFGNGNIKAIAIDILDSGNSGVLDLPFSTSQGTIILAPSGYFLCGHYGEWSTSSGDTIDITVSSTGNYNVVILGVAG